jgi:hypothetical protein
MRRGRWNHTATLLADGRVLIYGGERDGLFLRDAEIWDPASGSWIYDQRATFAAMAKHTATLLADGRVLIAGGWESVGHLENCHIFDLARPSPNGPIQLGDGPRMCESRDDHTASLLPDGSVLVAGGIGSTYPMSASERFVPGVERWIPAPSMFWTRKGHTASTLPDGRILVTGGIGRREREPGSRHDCTPRPAIPVVPFAPRPALPAPAPHPPSLAPAPQPYVEDVVLPTAEIYDPRTDSWMEIAPMHFGRVEHAAASLPDGRVLVSGGIIPGSRGYRDVSGPDIIAGMESAEVWDPATNLWTLQPPMAVRRIHHTETALPDGRVLVVGGGELNRDSPIEIWPPSPAPVAAAP